ncbi:MAG: hypothetical protein MMC23_008349 [Stictis urceolatum]|nr:hypothetical protein [Stictis urceolata]
MASRQVSFYCAQFYGRLTFRQGDDNTFGGFPEHLRALISHALPKISVRAVVYPKYDTRGDLAECVTGFRDWLQNKVIDLEVANGTPSPTVDPSVRVVLIGHSMGGIVAADTLLAIAAETPIPYSATSTPFPSSTTNSSTTATSVPPAPTARPDSPPHPFMFPYIQGVLAFDTPYLGISPGVIAHGAESHYQTASSAYTALSSAASAFGFGEAAGSTKQETKSSAGALPAGPGAAKDALAASADAAAVPAWQKWGRYAMFAGAAGAVAAGGAAAYLKRDQISSGWSWATSHLEFVGCLMRGEELKTRVQGLASAQTDRGVGFLVMYTMLGAAATKSGTTVAGGFVEIGGKEGHKRTFCNLPAREDYKGLFVGTVNEKASDEIQAHMHMFFPRDNPGYYELSERAKGRVVDWVQNSWYLSSDGKAEQQEVEGLEASTESLDGEEAVIVD